VHYSHLFFTMVQSFERRKMQKFGSLPHATGRDVLDGVISMTFYGCLGFPFCFYHLVSSGATYSQSGGFSTRLMPFFTLGFGVFLPGAENLVLLHLDQPQIQHLMSPCTTIQLSLSFYHITSPFFFKKNSRHAPRLSKLSSTSSS